MTCLALVSFVALILVALPLNLETRRKITGRAALIWFGLTGITHTITGQELLQESPAVVVANHASYIDGILLNAVLPPQYAFVIKREVTRAPFVHFLLRRIGAHFVERKNRYRGGKDARNIVEKAADGASVAVFPEGTFTATPGLAHFRSGAFAAAVAGQVPVIPLVITGSRYILPADRLLPRPGPIGIRILPPIHCTGSGRDAMRRLANHSRTAILEHLDEPDLLAQREAASGR
ncbi:MAG: 1-acyl-sn-glycerol-3-phosphate acyltransferase [Gammaproteobacteria bacterium]|nr:1-acyl-sn-glycerol-3-phosphate acyltransferase [Gammaproteobacteria bacterium]